ncbi:MAG TPA: ABC transporter ATP-binding protein, partial [Dehalococcoidia bacterium]|nr:ABC transporter ATP-binding protein [Dehalococcoidia bacterium]
MPILSAQKLKLLFGEVEIFSDVSLEVNEHARIGIVGPNGGGKTSLLRMLLGELDSDAGAVIRGSSIRIG